MATIKEKVGEENPDLTLYHSLGLLLVPPIGQTQLEGRVQGTPMRGSYRPASRALSRVDKGGERAVGQTEKVPYSEVMSLL